jgi:hypothetical protein
MHSFASRSGRWPVAFTIAALTALAACADEPVAPNAVPVDPQLKIQGAIPNDVTVTNTSGGLEVGSLRWAAEQVKGSTVNVAIRFDTTLSGKTIVLDAGLDLPQATSLIAPKTGVTISGKDSFRLITSRVQVNLTNITLTKGYSEFGSAIAGERVVLSHSTVHGNRGGTAVFAEKMMHLYNSTVSGNSVLHPAVYYLTGSNVYVESSTIAFNGPSAGLGMFDSPYPSGRAVIRNSIIANNGTPTQNCYNPYNYWLYGSIITNDWSCGEVGVTVADPKLMPLADNGGGTWTHAIPHTSPAYNTGWDCTYPHDQRYSPRDVKCDAGSFEFNDSTKVTLTIDPAVKLDATGAGVLTGTITCTRAETMRLGLELHQPQKVGKQVVDIHAANDIPVTCGTTPKAWTASMGLSAGETFKSGDANATAMTFQTPEWVKPASVAGVVKITFARK